MIDGLDTVARAGGLVPVPVPGPRRTSLYARVVAVNAVVLAAAAGALTVTPATVSFPVTSGEWSVLAAGLVAVLVANAVMLRISFRGLTTLVRRMDRLDLLRPHERLPEMGGIETRAVVAGVNAMLDRLEQERRRNAALTIRGQEDERSRIARELHDEIGQRLTGMVLLLGAVLEESPEHQRGRLRTVLAEARAALDETGPLAYRMHPAVLSDLGLRSGLEALVRSFQECGDERVEVVIGERLPALTGEQELVVYRIAQEALTNAVRHSGARRIRLGVRGTGDALELWVEDDGGGLAPPFPERQGLRGMRERALLIDASLDLDSAPGHGVRLRLLVPPAGGTR